MRDTIASDDGHLSTELMVREFRQVILYPLQLVPVEGKAKTQANWERLMAGRYGPYITDGTTNATLPRDKQPQGPQEGSGEERGGGQGAGEDQESGAEEEGCGGMSDRFKRHRQAWKPEELQKLHTLAAKGKALKGIAKALKRSEELTNDRARAEGIAIVGRK